MQQQAKLEQERTELQRQVDRLQGSKGTHEQNRGRALKELQVCEYWEVVVVCTDLCLDRLQGSKGAHEQYNKLPAIIHSLSLFHPFHLTI